MEDPRPQVDPPGPEDNPIGSGAGESNLLTRGTTGLIRRWGIAEPEQRLVAETLTWIGEHLGASRPRMVRRLPNGIWIVESLVNGKIIAQAADRAEIAMAWTVGLSGGPYRASRPRVTTPDGNGIRPIAVTTYVGIPVICRDEFLGVIEAAGKLRSDLDRALLEARPRLHEFAMRLVFDPAVRGAPHISADTECEISSGYVPGQRIQISGAEWEFIECLVQPMKISDLTVLLDQSEEEVVDTARALSSRSLVSLRSPTGILSTSPRSDWLHQDTLAET